MKERKQKTLAKRLLVAMLSVMMTVTFIPTSLLAFAAEPEEPATDDVQNTVQNEVVQEEPAQDVQKDEPQTEPTEAAKEQPKAKAKADKDTSEKATADKQYSEDLETVKVDVFTEEDAFAEEVKLVVKPLKENSDAFKDAETALAKSKQTYSGILAYDIHFESVKTGKEIEPEGTVSVEMQAKAEGLEGIKVEDFNADSVQMSHIVGKKAEVVADTYDKKQTGIEGTVEVDKTKKAVKSIDVAFEVESFSTFVLTWGDPEESATIHWCTMKADGTFDDFEIEDIAKMDTSASSISVANTFEGYTYLGTHYEDGTGADPVDIAQDLVKTETGWQITKLIKDSTGDVIEEQTAALVDGSDIYVVYSADSSASHGQSGDDVTGPTTDKKVTDNQDGTYTITIDVTAPIKEETVVHGANVLLVVDNTYSMSWGMSGQYSQITADNPRRFEAARSAILTLIDALQCDKNDIDLSMVIFNNRGSIHEFGGKTWTKDYQAVRNFVSDRSQFNYVTGQQGTNWQAGFYYANQALQSSERDTDDTYVIFLTDGEPNRTGNTSSQTATTAQAVAGGADQAKIATGTNHGILYNIFCGGSAGYNNLVSLNTTASGKQVINGTDAATLRAAFANIASTIVNKLGSTGVSVDDGVPSLASVSAAVAGEAGGYEYYKATVADPEDSDFEPWDDAPGASYSNDNGVTWDLDNVGQLEKDTTYRIKFTVWPSQEAYDLIADLNNGLKEYDDLTEKEKMQISGNKTDGYSMNTNTHLNTTYTFNGKTYTDPSGWTEEDMPLPTKTLSVEKKWNNPVDAHIGDDDDESPSVKLNLTKDGENYLYGDNAIIVAPPEDDPDSLTWVSSEEIYVSTGLISQLPEDDPDYPAYTVKESGHDYSISEPPAYSYYWDLTADTYHPMVINGVSHLLKLDESATGTDGINYYTINEKKYVLTDGEGQNVLKATNDRRSNLNLSKVINDQSDDQSANPGELFEYTVTINNANASTGTADNLNSDYYVWFSAYDPVAGATVKPLTTSATAEQGNTGYYYAQSGKSFTVSIKAGWNLRFINLPVGTDYTIVETSKTNWEFEGAKGSAEKYISQSQTVTEEYKPTVTKNSAKVEGNIPASNRAYYVAVTNKYEPTGAELTVKKAWVGVPNTVTKHGDITVALFRAGADGNLTYIEGSKKTISGAAVDSYPASVTYDKLASLDGIVVREVTVDGDTVTPIDESGTITVTNEVDGDDTASNDYTASYEQGTEADKARTDVITNTFAKVSKEGTKTWVDNNNENGKRPDHIIVQLLATIGDATETVGTYVIKLANSEYTPEDDDIKTIIAEISSEDPNVWNFTFEGLDKVRNGVEIIYSLVEDPKSVPGYTEDGTPEGSSPDMNLTNRINKHDVTVTKTFKGIPKDKVPAGFTVTPSYDGTAQTALGLSDGTASADGLVYTWTLKEVPYGTAVSVTENEPKVEGYTLDKTDTTYKATDSLTVADTDAAQTLTLVNPYKINKYDVTVTKTFDGLSKKEVPSGFKVTPSYDGTAQTALGLSDGTASADGLVYTWTLNNVEYGTKLTVAESGYEVTRYTVKPAVNAKDGNTAIELPDGSTTSATIDMPASENVSINFTNTYIYTDLELNKSVDAYWDHAEGKEGTVYPSFAFRVTGYASVDDEGQPTGNPVFETVVGVEFKSFTTENQQKILSKLPAGVVAVKVEEIASGNYDPDPKVVTATLQTDPKNPYRQYFSVTFANTLDTEDPPPEYISGVVNSYERSGTGYSHSASPGDNEQN